MRVALDSNILAYSAGVRRVAEDDAKIDRTHRLMETLGQVATLVAPAQALGELFTVMRRAGFGAEHVRRTLVELTQELMVPGTEPITLLAAADLVVDHKLQFWDAVIVSAAAESGCSLLLSEDMQHGFVVRGMTIVNPLVEPAHDRLAALLDSA